MWKTGRAGTALWLMSVAGLAGTGLPGAQAEDAEDPRDAEIVATDDDGEWTEFHFRLPSTLLGNTAAGKFYDDMVDRKNEILPFPVTLGAYHWWVVDRTGSDTGYGLSGLKGTYFYYATATPEIELKNDFIQKIGGHTEFRIRDNNKFRDYYDDKYWFYEAYGYVDTPAGKFKGGQLWTQFGLPWDGTFWGNTPYFDGFKLDPDWGVSWEKSWNVDEGLKLDSVVQFFFHDDGVNGSISGGGPESVTGSDEKNTGVVRLVPTWTLGEDSTIAVGVSGLAGQIENDSGVPVGDQNITAISLDATYTLGPFRVFGEAMHSNGVRNPTRYVSGGGSRRTTNFLVGWDYKLAFATFRTVYSAGIDDDPGGWQSLIVPQILLAVTRNIDLYLEYVNWQVYQNGEDRADFQDGFQFVINWRF